MTRAALTCECDALGCEGVPIAHLCEDHMPVPLPASSPVSAPTCEGWWWAKESTTGDWDVVRVLRLESTGQLLLDDGCPIRPHDFDEWSGPIFPPDATTAPTEER